MDREPDELRSDARDVLALWRDAQDMPADARARVQRRLDAPSSVRPQIATRTWTIAVALAAAVILAWWVGAHRGHTTQAQRDPARDQAIDRAADREPRPSSSTAAELPPAELPPAPSLGDTTGGDAPVDAPAAVRPRPAPSEAPSSSISTLEREKALIQQAWQTLAAGDPDGALRIVDSHARLFAEGVLAPERRAVAIVARCKRGDSDARARATTWLAADPRSPLAARVRAACDIESAPPP